MISISELLRILRGYLNEEIIPKSEEVPASMHYLLHKCFNSVKSNERDATLLSDIQSALDIIWEELNTRHWSNVPELYRTLYSIFSLFKVLTTIKETLHNKDSLKEMLKESIKAADLGLLLGCGLRKELTDAATLLNKSLSNEMNGESFAVSSLNSIDFDDFPEILKESIDIIECPSLEYFNKNYFNPELPVKLKECICHWPALKKWCNINYIKTTAGTRTVPIELGSSYTHEDWGMKLLTLEQFIEKHILSSSDTVGYLAQHQLFNQIPELKKDICIPEYCCLSKNDESFCEPDINAWFGPRGTITPLHYDPKHNLLSQVVGRKKILLYSPEDSVNLYPHDSKMLHNTARVDPQAPNFQNFPRYKLAKCYECILNPGEMLYIPPKWWHYVKSMDISFSVSFWWE